MREENPDEITIENEKQSLVEELEAQEKQRQFEVLKERLTRSS